MAHPRDILLGASLVIAVLLAYAPAFSAGFVWDDDDYVTRNPALKQMEGLDGLRAIWIPRNTPQYYPVVFTTFWIEEHVYPDDPDAPGGKSATGYHAVNIVLHVINSILLVIVLRRITVPAAAAWLIAFLFALHPVQVESVAWITERKNVLSTTFYLLAALAYLKFDRIRTVSFANAVPEHNGSEREGPWAWYFLAILLFILALLSKSVTASLPLAIVIALLYMRQRITWRRIWPLAPMLLLGAAAGLHTGWLERHHVGALGPDWDLSSIERGLIASRALLFYPWKILTPWSGMFNYPLWNIDAGAAISYWPLLVILFVVAFLSFLWRYKGLRVPALAAAFYAITIFPALGFANVFPMRFSFVADHFQYLASIGAISLVAAALYYVLRTGPALLITGILLSSALGVLTFLQTRHYKDEKTLYAAAIARNPDAWLMHGNLARVYLDEAQAAMSQGDRAALLRAAQRAEEHARQSMQIKPSHYRAPWSLAEALRLQKRIDEAIAAQQHSIDLLGAELQYHKDREYKNKIRWAHSELAINYALLGRLLEIAERTDDAIATYRHALELNKRAIGAQARMLPVHEALARLLTLKGDLEEAAPHYEVILNIHPDDLQAHLALGELRRAQKRYRDALAHLMAAAGVVANRDEELQVMYRIGWLRATARDDDVRSASEAVAIAEQFIVATGRSSPYALDLLAAAYAAAGRYNDAVAAINEAIALAGTNQLDDFLEALRERRKLYEEGRPYLE